MDDASTPPPDKTPRKPGDQTGLNKTPRGDSNLTPRYIKAEANLLRLPLFALHTKGLKTLDGIECRGQTTRNGETHSFVLTAARSTITPYPGPLARAAHLAFLSIATDGGFPIENPISWTWYDLCRRMRISYSGQTISRLKVAIESTKALYIRSHYAIYSKAEERPIRTVEDHLNLYDQVTFVGAELPGGDVADANYLWLASWYLDNLNAMFTAPLDYELWRWLDKQSPIASRLYEFLIVNFYSGAPKLCINYGKLAQYLPVKPERYLSQAKQQFAAAFRLLDFTDVIESAKWSDSKSDLAQVNIYPGGRLAAPGVAPARPSRRRSPKRSLRGPSRGQRTSETIKPPEWSLVADFYQLLTGSLLSQPTKKELGQAKALIAELGLKKSEGGYRARCEADQRTGWPEAKTFGAITRFVSEASNHYDRDQRRIEREQQDQLKRQCEREEKLRQEAERTKFEATWRPVWEALTNEEREEIRSVALNGSNQWLLKIPRLAEQRYLF